jgi:hypothetical protein
VGEEQPVPKLSASIPFLFYDLIARLAPGMLFILGFLFVIWRLSVMNRLSNWFCVAISSESTSGLFVAILSFAILFFCGFSTFIGFLLLSPSYLAVEKPFGWLWKLDLKGLQKYLGAGNILDLKQRFLKDFGFDLPEKAVELNRASFLCAYALWNRAPNLGAMSGRFDADLAACQSTVFVSFLLSCVLLYRKFCYGFDNVDSFLLILFATIFLASVSTFKYQRKKRVYGRFALYLALGKSPANQNENPQPPPKA